MGAPYRGFSDDKANIKKKNRTHKQIKTILQMAKDEVRNVKKRKTLFRLIREDKISFAALQEDLNILQKEWPETIHLSTGTRRSKGLITIFDKKKRGKKH